MSSLKDKRIALFFSYRISLNTWNDLGTISRENKTWDIFGKNFQGVFFITYGNSDEVRLMKYFPGVKLFNNKWNLNPIVYSLLLPIFYKKELSRIDFYRLNQLSGALPAIICKVLYKKKLIVRCGFQLSLFFKEQNESKMKVLWALILERIAYCLADTIIVASAEDRKYVIAQHKVNADKIKIIPNGIDTRVFSILDKIEKEPGRILFVGRLIKQKNLFSLLEAVQGISGAHLVIIGNGYLKKSLIKIAMDYGINATFIDKVENKNLPVEYNKSEIFVLPSFFEGNPKVLLEAMACGLAIVGSNVDGINSIIKDKFSGFLCEPVVESIRAAILGILSDKHLIKELGRNARNYIEKNFDLEELTSKEMEIVYAATS